MKTTATLTLLLFVATITNVFSQITVYKDCDYKGASQRLFVGEYRADQLGVGNDQISSIKIPNGLKVIAFQDNDFRGGSQTIKGDQNCLTGDWNDHISSIRVERNYPTNTKPVNDRNPGASKSMITVYEDNNFRGKSFQFAPKGNWNVKDGFPNDRISSIRVPRGLKITVYTDDFQKGFSRTFTSDVSSFDVSLNDKVSSITVERVNGNTGPGSKLAVLYRDCDFRGSSLELGQGAYGANSLGKIGNDQLSSLRLPSGWQAVLYADDNFRGRSMTITSDTNCLPRDFNDSVSSMIISILK